MRNLEYQAKKETRPETNPKIVVLEKYHNLLNVFSKKNSDIFPSNWKYDHKIILEAEQKYSYFLLCKILPQEFDAVKPDLDLHLTKEFIKINWVSYSSLVLFIKKPSRQIRFCVNYRKLNVITKKDHYPISLIEKTLAQLENAKYFTKIDIYQVFY